MSNEQPVAKFRLIVRVVLFAVLAIAILALVIDRDARQQSQIAYDLVSDLEATAPLHPTKEEVENKIRREPAESKSAYGGIIEEYRYKGGLPGRSYHVFVAFVEENDGKMRYVEHYLNEIDDESLLKERMQSRVREASAAARRRQGRTSFVERMMSNDDNRDGKITAEELPENRRQMVETGDSNGDKALDKGELEAMVARFRARGRGRGQNNEGGSNDGDDQRPRRPARPEME